MRGVKDCGAIEPPAYFLVNYRCNTKLLPICQLRMERLTNADYYSTVTEVLTTILLLYAGLICLGLLILLFGWICTTPQRKPKGDVIPIGVRYVVEGPVDI